MDVMLIFDVVIAIFGVYMIGAALKMKKTGKISSAVITAEEIARCRKTKEFITFIYWKEAVFGALIIAVGVLGIINDKVVSLGAFNVVELLIFLAAFVVLIAARQNDLHKDSRIIRWHSQERHIATI